MTGRDIGGPQRPAVRHAMPIVLAYVALAALLYTASVSSIVIGLLGVFFVGLAALLFIRPTLSELAVYLTCGFAFTASWNAVHAGPLRPSDLFLAGAAACFGALWLRTPIPRLPWWLLILSATVLLGMTAHEMWAQNVAYLNSRVRVNALGFDAQVVTTNFAQASKWLVSLIVVPLTICGSRLINVQSTRWIAASMALGTGVSGLVGISDRMHLTHISRHLVGPSTSNRQLGLTLHPNHLSTACIIALPIAVWLLGRTGPHVRLLGTVALITCAGGAYLSGSRSGAVAALAAIGVGALVVPRVRRQLPLVMPVVALVGAIGLVFVPGVSAQLAKTTRLGSGGEGVSGSDAVRSNLAAQAANDFAHSPFDGIGYQVVLNAHDIYLQMAAAGGVFLLLGFFIFSAGMLFDAYRSGRVDPLGYALLTSVAIFLLAATVSNILSDRYLYITVGLIASLVMPFGRHDRGGTRLREPAVALPPRRRMSSSAGR